MVAENSPRRLRIWMAGRFSILLGSEVEETGAMSFPAVTIPKGRPKAREPMTSNAKKLSPGM
jgi:hypothetical protein